MYLCARRSEKAPRLLFAPAAILSSDFGPRLFIFLHVCLWPSQTSSLQYLDARNTPLLDHSAPFVARALRISGSLAVLHLENAGLSGRPLMLLGKALATPAEHILPRAATSYYCDCSWFERKQFDFVCFFVKAGFVSCTKPPSILAFILNCSTLSLIAYQLCYLGHIN